MSKKGGEKGIEKGRQEVIQTENGKDMREED